MLFFLQLGGVLEGYSITADNICNWDEKSLVIGQATSTKRIMAKEAYYSGRIRFASQDGSREFISLLACIGATGTALPPMLVYKGESMTLQDTWVEDFDVNKTPAYFTTSLNGWSCVTAQAD